MMRPESLALPPLKADGLVASVVPHQEGRKTVNRIQLQWNDNSINETSFVVQRTKDGTTWTDVATSDSPLGEKNVHEVRTVVDPTSVVNLTRPVPYRYRVVALNAVGYGSEFPSMTVTSVSDELGVNAPEAPTALTATVRSGPSVLLRWQDNATSEAGFSIERSADAGATWSQIATRGPRSGTGAVAYTDATVSAGSTYEYRVSAVNIAGTATSVPVSLAVTVPDVPVISSVTAVPVRATVERIQLAWADVANETSYTIQWSATSDFSVVSGSVNRASNTTSYQTGNLASSTTWYLRVRATNVVGSSAWSAVSTVPAAP